MESNRIRRSIAGALVASALTTAALGTPATAATTPAPARAAVSAASSTAASWQLQGFFPDPITCAIAGATSGRAYYCTWYVFFWGLYTLEG